MFDRKRNPLFLFVHVEHDDLDDIAHGQNLARVADKLVADLGDVNQAVLMDADVHKSPKVDDISHRAGEHHTGLEVADLQYVLSEQDGRQLVARVAARFQ